MTNESIRLFSDRALAFLAEKNIFEGNNSEEFFEIAIQSNGQTYTSPYHPLFKRYNEEILSRKSREELVRSQCGLLQGNDMYVQGIRRYLAATRAGEMITPEMSVMGPHGHPNKLFHFRKFPILTTLPIPAGSDIEPNSLLWEYPGVQTIEHMLAGDFEANTLLDRAYCDIAEDILEVSPRFYTLLARDAKWNTGDIDRELSSHFYHPTKIFDEVTLKLTDKTATLEDIRCVKQSFLEFRDASKIIRSYFENNVKYQS